MPEGVVVVTGTNGKTTTTKMVATILGQKYRVLTNDTGSNFVRGAITATVENATWSGRLPYDVAVFELDEAWAVRFVAAVPPRRALLLNVMRDQLDRFGEIDTTAGLLGKVAAATTGHVVLNRDDERVAALATRTSAAVSYYGVAAELREMFPTDEELYGGPVHYADQVTSAELLRLPGGADQRLRMRIDTSEHDLELRAEGPHNAQNATGAAALALTFGLDADTVAAGLAEVSPAFGRGQRFTVDGRQVVLQLVKNPAGFRQTLRTLDNTAGRRSGHRDQRRLRRRARRVVAVGRRLRRARAHIRLASRPRARAPRTWRCGCATTRSTPPRSSRIRRRRCGWPSPRSTSASTVVVFSTYTAMWELHAVLLRIGEGDLVITLVHLYPREMNIYGDTGNVIVLKRRLQWRGFDVRVVPINIGDPLPHDADILLGGGGQDAAQGDIGADFAARGTELRAMADDGVVMLTICGTYQMLGHEFITQEGRHIKGVGVLDVITRGQHERLIGNNFVDTPDAGRLVGYENHSGMTELGPGVRPLGTTQTGRGNNGKDRTEGAVRDNVIGTYLHGPVLAKSARFADDLIRRALRRQGRSDELEPLDDDLADRAARVAVGRPR